MLAALEFAQRCLGMFSSYTRIRSISLGVALIVGFAGAWVAGALPFTSVPRVKIGVYNTTTGKPMIGVAVYEHRDGNSVVLGSTDGKGQLVVDRFNDSKGKQVRVVYRGFKRLQQPGQAEVVYNVTVPIVLQHDRPAEE